MSDPEPSGDAGVTVDGGVGPEVSPGERDADGVAPGCDRTKPFGTPRLVPGLDTNYTEGGASLSPDGLLFLYHANTTTGDATRHIFVAERPSTTAPFGAGRAIDAEQGTTMLDPHLALGRAILFTTADEGGPLHIEVATLGPNLTLEERTTIGLFGSESASIQPYATATRLYFASDRGGTGYHVHVATREGDELAAPVRVDELAGTGSDWRPVVTPDDLTIYFARSPTSDVNGMDIFVARRASPNDAFGPPVRVDELSAPGVFDHPTWVSADECVIYFESVRRTNAGGDVWMAERLP